MPRGVYIRKIIPPEIRFHSKYVKDESTGCWNWTGALTYGYGSFKLTAVTIRAHRYSYEIHTGLIPRGMVIRHSCDNRKCVNPAHLELGTQQDNIDDMHNRGRNVDVRGEAHPRAKLTENDVISIRCMLADGLSYAGIVKMYPVSHKAIHDIKHKITWEHVTNLETY